MFAIAIVAAELFEGLMPSTPSTPASRECPDTRWTAVAPQ